eukprot:TRINITY_DN3563_c0_g1_i1.p2 TRINITY_DN3563_c0_g1~~TRINITY_DN3563_c0_g1_i1.p2  ORF type:complete len:120 (+),score=4.46 TRINITY_DN3563_c0_g1_i1:166-525(+)
MATPPPRTTERQFWTPNPQKFSGKKGSGTIKEQGHWRSQVFVGMPLSLAQASDSKRRCLTDYRKPALQHGREELLDAGCRQAWESSTTYEGSLNAERYMEIIDEFAKEMAVRSAVHQKG